MRARCHTDAVDWEKEPWEHVSFELLKKALQRMKDDPTLDPATALREVCGVEADCFSDSLATRIREHIADVERDEAEIIPVIKAHAMCPYKQDGLDSNKNSALLIRCVMESLNIKLSVLLKNARGSRCYRKQGDAGCCALCGVELEKMKILDEMWELWVARGYDIKAVVTLSNSPKLIEDANNADRAVFGTSHPAYVFGRGQKKECFAKELGGNKHQFVPAAVLREITDAFCDAALEAELCASINHEAVYLTARDCEGLEHQTGTLLAISASYDEAKNGVDGDTVKQMISELAAENGRKGGPKGDKKKKAMGGRNGSTAGQTWTCQRPEHADGFCSGCGRAGQVFKPGKKTKTQHSKPKPTGGMTYCGYFQHVWVEIEDIS